MSDVTNEPKASPPTELAPDPAAEESPIFSTLSTDDALPTDGNSEEVDTDPTDDLEDDNPDDVVTEDDSILPIDIQEDILIQPDVDDELDEAPDPMTDTEDGIGLDVDPDPIADESVYNDN